MATEQETFEVADTLQPSAEIGPAPADISIGIRYPGNRADRLTVPLSESEMDVAVEPDDAYERDIVICDNADRSLGREVIRNRFTDSTLVYRLRGDVFHELDLWDMHPIKHKIATRGVLPNVDGVIAVSDRLAEKYNRKTGVPSFGAGLAKDPDNWPDVSHDDQEIRAVTLTNMNYWKKVSPLVEWAEIIETVLSDIGGIWRICGDGDHADRIAQAMSGYSHVEYAGLVDPHETLADSNVMLHPSLLDGQPNSVLEGMASGLPVATNDFAAFTEFGGPINVVHTKTELVNELHALANPSVRAVDGDLNERYIRHQHNKRAIARQYERACQHLLA